MFTKSSWAVAAIVLSGGLLGACGDDDDGGGGGGGGSDVEQVKATINDYAKATGKEGCDLLTQRFIEEQSGRKGAAAMKLCREQFSGTAAKGLKLEQPAIAGNRATISATTDGQTGTFTLLQEGGDWKIDSIKGPDESTSTTAKTTATAPTATTKEEYLTRVNKLCADSEPEFKRIRDRLGDNADIKQVTTVLTEFAKFESTLLTKIAGVIPPTADAKAVADVTAAMGEVATSTATAAAAGATGNKKGLATATGDADKKAKAFEAKAKAYGIKLAGGCKPTQ